MAVRGLRGAINARENTAASILEATRELLQEIIRAYGTLKSIGMA